MANKHDNQHDDQPVMDGTTYPVDNAVVAEIDSYQEADAAAKALQQAGFASDTINVFKGPEALARIHERERELSPWERLWRKFRNFGGNEDINQENRMRALAEGHALIAVLTPHDEDVERAHRVLVEYHAKLIRAFGNATVTSLPSKVETSAGG